MLASDRRVFTFVRIRLSARFNYMLGELLGMPTIELEEQTLARLDRLRIEDESYDEIINELIGIYQASEMTLAFGGEENY